MLRGLIGLMVFIASIFMVPDSVNAASEPTGTESGANLQTRDANGNLVSCKDIPNAKGVLMGKIVPCVLYTIQQSTIKFAEQMVDMLNPIMMAFLTLVVVIFGVKVASNEPEVYKQGLILLIKIAIVGVILGDLGNYRSFDGSGSQGQIIPAVYGVMNESQTIVAGALDASALKCDVAAFEAGGSPKIWALMDCLAGKVFGFTVTGGSGNGSMLLMTSLAGLLAGMFVSGPWGVAIVLGMLAVIVSIMSIMVRTATSFINCYLIICLLLIISPLILPLMFLKATTQYYEPIVKNILASLLTPVIFTVFTLFTLTVYDKILFADDSIVQKLMSYDMIKDALEPPTQPCSWTVTNNPTAVRAGKADPTDQDITKVFSKIVGQNIAAPLLAGGNDPCAGFKVGKLNLPAVGSPEYQKGKETYEKIFMDLAKLVILSFLMITALDQLPTLIMRLSAGGSAVFYAVNDGNNSIDQRFMNASKAAMGEAIRDTKAPGDQSTARQMGTTTKASLEKFYNVMQGKE